MNFWEIYLCEIIFSRCGMIRYVLEKSFDLFLVEE